jgi:hypothetical protein
VFDLLCKHSPIPADLRKFFYPKQANFWEQHHSILNDLTDTGLQYTSDFAWHMVYQTIADAYTKFKHPIIATDTCSFDIPWISQRIFRHGIHDHGIQFRGDEWFASAFDIDSALAVVTPETRRAIETAAKRVATPNHSPDRDAAYIARVAMALITKNLPRV